MHKSYNAVLTIAGSDSGGGAGIQADIKSISANGGFAATAITATTAQNTQGVMGIHPIPLDHLRQQLEAVLSDIDINAIKIGMLHNRGVIECVRDVLKDYPSIPVVLDPVMVATSGAHLIDREAVAALCELLPLVELITPNIPEAAVLLGLDESPHDLRAAAQQLAQQFQVSVLLKGGHQAQPELSDLLITYPGAEMHEFTHARVGTENTHGTGCTLSAAIATHLGHGLLLPEAVARGVDYVHQALVAGAEYQLGHGHGPVHHFWQSW